MPVLLGIDEAGYGPKLGPLVSTGVVIRSAEPDPWKAMGPLVVRPGKVKQIECCAPLIVGDSKKVYTGKHGLGRLERTVLAFVGMVAGKELRTADEFLSVVCMEDPREFLRDLPWYEPGDEQWPLANELPEILHATEVLRETSQTNGMHLVAVRAGVLTAREFNIRCEGQNKAEVLWDVVQDHLLFAARQGQGPVSAVVDRLGGRRKYGGLLQEAFRDGMVWTVQEAREVSAYKVQQQGMEMDVAFRVGADRDWFCVALAGMVSKYIRELLMARLNRFFGGRGARPTAGYPVDAEAWLDETAALRAELAIDDARLVRTR